ncbi:MAG: thioredoxin-disulfide reductase [Myxococcales bacterium]|nr:thioredoxin-disulfide reductase [Myxococcales bacterium]
MTFTRVAIIGSGPAGFTAALYAARANLEPIVFEGGFIPGNQSVLPGGQLMITTDVENFPGFPEGIMGPDLMAKMRTQAERFGTRVIHGFVDEVAFDKSPFQLTVGTEQYTAGAVIIATGAVAKLLEVPGERELMGYGVSACATCDGAFFRDKHVAIVGGGDTAMEEALFLTKFASKVSVLHRRNTLRASKIMADRALEHPKVEFIWNTVVNKVLGTKPQTIGGAGGLEGLEVKNTQTGELSRFDCDGFFVAIGHRPTTDLFRNKVDLDSEGYIAVQPGSTQTSVHGVFACGDVADKIYRQAITAAGTGCMAAIDAERWLAVQG